MPRKQRTAQSLGGAEPLFLPKNTDEARYAAQARAATTCIAYAHLPIAIREGDRLARVAKPRQAAREYRALHQRYDRCIALARSLWQAGDEAGSRGYDIQVQALRARLDALYPLLASVGTMNLQAAA